MRVGQDPAVGRDAEAGARGFEDQGLALVVEVGACARVDVDQVQHLAGLLVADHERGLEQDDGLIDARDLVQPLLFDAERVE